MSLGLGRRREEVVPRGEVSTRARAPRGMYFRLTRHCTCSRYLTCNMVRCRTGLLCHVGMRQPTLLSMLSQPSVIRETFTFIPFSLGSSLLTVSTLVSQMCWAGN